MIQVHPNQFYGVEAVFDKGKKSDTEPSAMELRAKIGRLTMENDFLSVVLELIHGPSEMIDRNAELPPTRLRGGKREERRKLAALALCY